MNISEKRPGFPDYLLYLTLALVLIARLQLLDMPLERDEGGYAYIGQRMLFGAERVYTDMYDVKLPGLYLMYGLFDLLPGGPSFRIHTGFLLVHAGALYLFFLLAKSMFNRNIAAVATALFAVSAVMPGVYGFAAHATQLLQLPLMAALLILWREAEKWWKLVLIGLLLGFAFTIKQPAVVFILFAIGVLMLEKRPFIHRIGRSFVLGVATLIPFGLISGYFMMQGRFDDFWFWTFTMATAQTVGGETWTYLSKLVPMMIGNHWLFWMAGVASLALLPFLSLDKKATWWTVGLLSMVLLSTAIGMGFMPHYFIPAIPWAALGISAALYHFTKGSSGSFTAAAALFALSPVLLNTPYFLRPNLPKIAEECYHWNGFAEIKAIGEKLKHRMKSGETIAILGSEPQLNYYTGTTHCSPQLYMYPVIRNTPYQARHQQQFMENFDQCKANWLIITASEASWMPGFTETPFFKTQLMPRVNANYTLIGRANIGQLPMSIVWDDALKTHQPPQCPPILIFKRK